MTRPLRFCMVTTFYPPYNFGGDGIFVHHLSNELARRGHHVEVIHCIDAYRSLGRDVPLATYENHPNVTVHGLKSPFGCLSPLATQQTGSPVFKSGRIRQLLQQGFDVIHYHNISLVGGPKILEYGDGIKLYTMHEYWLICPTHMLFKFNRAPCIKQHCFLCSLAHKRPPQWWRHGGLLERAAKHVDAFIAPSRFSRDLHQVRLNVPVVHLPNFVPLSDGNATQTSNSAPFTVPYFLFVGRLERLKGVQTLIPLFRRYRKAQLWIAGTGNYESHLHGLTEGSDNIRFLGHRSQDQLEALYRQAVAVIVPSLYYEIFGLVIIEAFKQQTPAIVRNLGAMPEIIEESNGGFVYDSDAELEAAMDRLLENPSRRHEMGLCAYQAYLQNWTAESHLEGYFSLIHKIAATRG